MLNLDEANVLAWLTPIRPATGKIDWPPAVRPLERAPAAEPLLIELGAVLSEIETQNPSLLPVALSAAPVRTELQTVIAQLGAARLLRILDWLASNIPEAPRLFRELSEGSTANAQAIRSAIRALTARNTLTRMFSLDRVTTVQACAEAAINPQETPQC